MNLRTMGVRPCGACGELVSAEVGCKHWRPDLKWSGARQARYRQRGHDREQAERLRRILTPRGRS